MANKGQEWQEPSTQNGAAKEAPLQSTQKWMKLWDIGPFKDIAASEAAFAELQAKDYIRYENLPLETKAGRKREVEFISNAYEVGEQRFIQCNIRDITDRKREEEERGYLADVLNERTLNEVYCKRHAKHRW